MAAATTSRCQCCTRFSARAPSSFTTLRADSSGTMWLTPSSTAFSMVQSIFSAVLRHCARPSRRRGGGSAGRAACSVTVAGFVEATCARQHRPCPSKTSITSLMPRRNTRSRWCAAGSSSGRGSDGTGGAGWSARAGRWIRGVIRSGKQPSGKAAAGDRMIRCLNVTKKAGESPRRATGPSPADNANSCYIGVQYTVQRFLAALPACPVRRRPAPGGETRTWHGKQARAPTADSGRAA